MRDGRVRAEKARGVRKVAMGRDLRVVEERKEVGRRKDWRKWGGMGTFGTRL